MMFKKKQFSDWGGYLFVLLCIVLLRGHSQGMVTLFAVFSILFVTRINQLNATSFLLILFSFFYVLISFANGAMGNLGDMIIYGLPWFIFYSYGRYVANRVRTDRDIVLFLIVIAFCFGFPVYLSTIQKIISSGSLVDTTRSYYLFNDESQIVASTGICVGIFIGYIGLPAFMMLKEWKLERWLFLLLFVFSVLVPINVVTRFPLVVVAVCFVIGVLIQYKESRYGALGFVLLAAAFVFILYSQSSSVGQIFDAYADRNADKDNLSTLGTRSLIWSDAFSLLFRHPFGWYGTVDYNRFMHNMWLDVASYSGWIPFILLVILTIKSFIVNYQIIKILKSNLSFIFLLLNICFCMVAFVEPSLGGLTVGLGCMIWGLQETYLQKIRKCV